MHFLIVDDDTVARNVLKNHLQNMFPDCKISEAPNGAQGLFFFFKKNPDMIFLDILMPIVDGRVFLDVLLENYRCGKIVKKPKIILSTMLETAQIAQMHPLGDQSLVAAVIKKPMTKNKLQIIEELLP